MVKAGQKAPEFTLEATNGKKLSLHSYRGKNVMVAFYCFCFSPVCTMEFQDFSKHFAKFKRSRIEIVGLSIDSTWVQRAWARLLKLPFPLVSDFQKTVAKKFGVLNRHGFANRSYFLVDKKGIVRYAFIEKSPLNLKKSEELLKEFRRVL